MAVIINPLDDDDGNDDFFKAHMEEVAYKYYFMQKTVREATQPRATLLT